MSADILMDAYKTEVLKKIEAWGDGLKVEDFQYEPERAELKNQMKLWLAEKLDIEDEAKLKISNRKYFAKAMAQLVYEQKVRPNIDDFMHWNEAR